MNVSMAYIQAHISSNNNLPSGYDDYNIMLSAGNVTRSSTNFNSSTEMIYTNLFSSNDRYNLKISKSNNSSSNIYGYAWSAN